jgi:hypothetical protein
MCKGFARRGVENAVAVAPQALRPFPPDEHLCNSQVVPIEADVNVLRVGSLIGMKPLPLTRTLGHP